MDSAANLHELVVNLIYFDLWSFCKNNVNKRKQNQWLLRDLSLRGRILIPKEEGISLLTHAALVHYLENKLLREIEKVLFDFSEK